MTDSETSDSFPEQLPVMAINPFWRWAIIPRDLWVNRDAHLAPALPFMRRSRAERKIREMQGEIGDWRFVLARRRWPRGFEIVDVL
jgi:hypothetical protein